MTATSFLDVDSVKYRLVCRAWNVIVVAMNEPKHQKAMLDTSCVRIYETLAVDAISIDLGHSFEEHRNSIASFLRKEIRSLSSRLTPYENLWKVWGNYDSCFSICHAGLGRTTRTRSTQDRIAFRPSCNK